MILTAPKEDIIAIPVLTDACQVTVIAVGTAALVQEGLIATIIPIDASLLVRFVHLTEIVRVVFAAIGKHSNAVHD